MLAVSVTTVLMGNQEAVADEVDGPVPDQWKWRPSPEPDRILLSWTNDPATSAAVAWRTNTEVKKTIGQIAPASEGPDVARGAVELIGTHITFKSNLSTSLRHTVTFKDLTPDTQYLYRVGDGKEWSEWILIRTAALDSRPFRFVYFGDAQIDIRSRWSRVVRLAYTEAPRAAFFMHAGDLINNANNDAQWGEWFYAGGFIHRSTPCLASPGNHEYNAGKLSAHWQPSFAFPRNGPRGLEESCYWLDYQGVRLISLNSNEKTAEQAVWLRTVLKRDPQRWTILFFHHPLYSAKAGRDSVALRTQWQPVIDEFRVDLVLQGHDHTYARTGLMTGDSDLVTGAPTRDSQTGTVYVVSVSGPKMYEMGERPFMVRKAEDTQLYQLISVEQDVLTVKAYTATGRIYDAFTLTKQTGAPNRLTNQIPDSPERLRPPPPPAPLESATPAPEPAAPAAGK